MAVADTDSYLKWSVATLRALPAAWPSTQVVIKNPVRPSAEQIRAAAGGPVEVLSYAAVSPAPDRATRRRAAGLHRPGGRGGRRRRLFRGRTVPCWSPACRGSACRPPLEPSARAGCDLFLLHSHREIAEFTALAAELGVRTDLRPGHAAVPRRAARPPPTLSRAARRGVRRPGQGADAAERPGADPAGPGRAGFGRGQAPGRRARSGRPTTSPGPTRSCYADLVRQGRIAPDALHFAAGLDGRGAGAARGAGHGVVDGGTRGHGGRACRC